MQLCTAHLTALVTLHTLLTLLHLMHDMHGIAYSRRAGDLVRCLLISLAAEEPCRSILHEGTP